jgi:hypothetical protein
MIRTLQLIVAILAAGLVYRLFTADADVNVVAVGGMVFCVAWWLDERISAGREN